MLGCHVIVSVPHDPVLGTPANYLKVTVWQFKHAWGLLHHHLLCQHLRAAGWKATRVQG